MRPINRIAPNMPARSMQTFQIVAPKETHTRPATCEEAECPQYLRGWRMTLAAEYLADPDVTVAAVARRVGYSDAFTFSAAFKRERGVAPSTVRA